MDRPLDRHGEPFLHLLCGSGFRAFFLKFCTYFPHNAKRQLANKGIGFKALDNGVLECDDTRRLQAICDGLSGDKIDALLRKWPRLLPHPFSPADRKAGFRYQVSILQAEFSLTQVLDRAVTGRIFCEEVIRENLDIGRPGQVQLIFDRRVTVRTPRRSRTRVITDGVIPSLHVDYKNTRIKQYHKEGRALRTETTINNTRDFGIGKLLKNLPALRRIGFQANRRLLDVQRVSHDCATGKDAFDGVVRPAEVERQRASALRFGDKRVQALFAALVLFSLQLRGFHNREMRLLQAQPLGLDAANYPVGRTTYDLRVYVCTESSSAFRAAIAINSPRMAFALRSSSPEPMRGCCAPNSPRSFPGQNRFPQPCAPRSTA